MVAKPKPTTDRVAELRQMICEYEAAIRGAESELRQIEAAAFAPPADYALPNEIEVYHRRRRLVNELSAQAPAGSTPLLVAQVEAIADLVIDEGLEIDTAIRQVTVGADEEENEDDN